MTVTVADLRLLVNSGPSDEDVLQRCLVFGESVVESVTARATRTIPAEILDEAVLTAAADHFQRRKAPNGILNQVYESADGVVPVRIGGDPADGIRTMLASWLPTRGGLRSVSISP